MPLHANLRVRKDRETEIERVGRERERGWEAKMR